jgi:hypothetical protein
MKLLFYKIMIQFCWRLEEIWDYFNPDKNGNEFYPSAKWEDLYMKEKEKLNDK